MSAKVNLPYFDRIETEGGHKIIVSRHHDSSYRTLMAAKSRSNLVHLLKWSLSLCKLLFLLLVVSILK